MKRFRVISISFAVIMSVISCNHGLSSSGSDSGTRTRRDRSQRTAIDNAEYIDFTSTRYNAKTIRREDMIYALNGIVYKNENSSILIKATEGIIEITSDSGSFEGKKNCQVYGVFGFDIQAASDDCLYIRKDHKKEGFLMVNDNIFRNDAMPDLAVCLPLYGYSRNRIEVSSVMDGYIIMPSGTYWKK